MSDLLAVAVLKSVPGGEDTVRDALRALVAPTRDEAGCRSYDLYESASIPGTFVTVERWGAQSDLDAHMQTPHIAAALQAAGESLAEPPAIHVLAPLDVTDSH